MKHWANQINVKIIRSVTKGSLQPVSLSVCRPFRCEWSFRAQLWLPCRPSGWACWRQPEWFHGEPTRRIMIKCRLTSRVIMTQAARLDQEISAFRKLNSVSFLGKAKTLFRKGSIEECHNPLSLTEYLLQSSAFIVILCQPRCVI